MTWLELYFFNIWTSIRPNSSQYKKWFILNCVFNIQRTWNPFKKSWNSHRLERRKSSLRLLHRRPLITKESFMSRQNGFSRKSSSIFTHRDYLSTFQVINIHFLKCVKLNCMEIYYFNVKEKYSQHKFTKREAFIFL